VRLEQQGARMQRVLRERGSYLLELDDEARSLAAEQGLTVESVPQAGRFVPLRRKSNISAGGIQVQVQVADCHPDNIALAVRATRAVRLDLCGVDLIIPDIARSWLETGAVIVELNAEPQIGWYHGPEAYAIVLKKMLGGRWDLPLYLAVCDTGAVPAGQQQAAALFAGCGCNAFSTPRGAWIDGQCMTAQALNGHQAAQVLLLDTRVRCAGMVLTLEEIRQFGLPAGRFERILFMKPAVLEPADRERWAEVESMVRDNAGEHAVAQAA
jgi:cyanophycin synthetase